jgi:hypothetical protein
MNLLNQQFTIHPVGQGFFYSGEVKLENITSHKTCVFRFVFDCGSKNKDRCTDEAEHFNRTYFTKPDEPLDLLMISHFDSDHVNYIETLLNTRKVKTIIAPFVSFEERLMMALRLTVTGAMPRADSKKEDLLTLMLDPLTILQSYLTDDGEIILVNSDGESFVFPELESEAPELPDVENRSGLIIRGEKKEMTTDETAELRTGVSSKVKVTTDKIPPLIFLNGLSIMQFLLYHKKITTDDKAFYKKVYEKFVKKFISPIIGTASVTIHDLVSAIKKIKNATEIKILFKEVADELDEIDRFASASDIKNLNTTALCMLHVNMPPLNKIDKLLKGDTDVIRINILQEKGNYHRTEQSLFFSNFEHSPFKYKWLYYFLDFHDDIPHFPNTLLTSDAFIKKNEDVTAFCNRYQHFVNKFWLFQVPHHGSAENCDSHLLIWVPEKAYVFINHGVQIKKEKPSANSGHPAYQLTSDIKTTNHEHGLIHVTENAGLRIKLGIHIG